MPAHTWCARSMMQFGPATTMSHWLFLRCVTSASVSSIQESDPTCLCYSSSTGADLWSNFHVCPLFCLNSSCLADSCPGPSRAASPSARAAADAVAGCSASQSHV
eukprot:1881236-Pyramimonas_sp.AAC.1